MANSNLITLGLGGNLITHGLGGVTIEVEEPVIQRGGGGGAGLAVPQAVVIAKALVKIQHVNPIISRFVVLTNNIFVKSAIPVKIRKIAVSFKTLVAGVSIQSFVHGLKLDIQNKGFEDE